MRLLIYKTPFRFLMLKTLAKGRAVVDCLGRWGSSMKIYGPMHALNSPIVLGALGLHALDSIVGLYHDYAQGQQNDILAKSALSGQPVTSEPGGPIRHALSTITGGLVNRDVQATPQTLLGERAYQGAQQKAQLQNVSAFSGIRKNLGPTAFTPGGPLASMATKDR